MTTAISDAEAAQQKAHEAAEALEEAQMTHRRVSLRVDNGDPDVTADDLENASKQLRFAERVAVAAQKAADAAASGQVAEDARAAVAALLTEHGDRASHIEDVRPLVAAAAQALAAAVELVRTRNEAIRQTSWTVARAKKAVPAGVLDDLETAGYDHSSLQSPPVGTMDVKDVLAAAICGAIGQGDANDSGHSPNASGKIGTAARGAFDSDSNPFRIEG